MAPENKKSVPPPIFTRVKDIREWCRKAAMSNLSIGFVPTLGALHEGHASLIRKCRKKNDVTVVSIFLNPTQFDNPDDLDNYPKTPESDLMICAREGVSAVFAPPPEEIYKKSDRTSVIVHRLTDVLCGISRAGHFRGVCTVVTKLLNIIRPTRAYFGEKDAQQLAIIKRMAADLMMDVEIVSCPIVRDSDGLALSSRNIHLNPKMREEAALMAQILQQARQRFNDGEKSPMKLCSWLMEEIITQTVFVEVDYAQLVRLSDLVEISEIESGVEYMLAIAAFVGKDNPVRLIDNVLLTG